MLDPRSLLQAILIWKLAIDLGRRKLYADGKYTFHNRPGTVASVKNRLEEFRKLRGIRQEDLAADLEVSRQTIGSLENGRYNPSIVLAIRIARYFGVPVEEMFIYEE